MKKQAQQNKPTFSYARYLGSNQEEKEQIKQLQQKSKELEKLADDMTGRLNVVKQSTRDYTLCGKQNLQTLVLKELGLTSWEPVRQSGQSIFDYASLDKNIFKKTEKEIGRLGLAEAFHRKDPNEQLIKQINLGIETLSEFNSALDNFATEAALLTSSDVSSIAGKALEKMGKVIENILDTWASNKIFLSTGNKIHLETLNEAIKRRLSNQSIADDVSRDFDKMLKTLKKDFTQSTGRVNRKEVFGSIDARPEIDNKTFGDAIADVQKTTEMKIDVGLIASAAKFYNLNDTQVERFLQAIKQINIKIFIQKVKYTLISQIPSTKSIDKETTKTAIAFMLSTLEPRIENYKAIALGIKSSKNNNDFFGAKDSEYKKGFDKAIKSVKRAMAETEVSTEKAVENDSNKEVLEAFSGSLDSETLPGEDVSENKVATLSNPVKASKWNTFKYSFLIFALISAPIGVFTDLFFALNVFDLLIALLGIYGVSLSISFWVGGESNG